MSCLVTAIGGQASHLELADFNRDGHLDIALNDFDAPAATSVAVLLGNGDGTLRAATRWSGGAPAIGLTSGDLDGDGLLDLATVTEGDPGSGRSSLSTFLRNSGDGSFAHTMPQSVSGEAEEIVAGDFNEDGALDLMMSDISTWTITPWLGAGGGLLRSQPVVKVPFIPGRLVAARFLGPSEIQTGVAIEELGGHRLALANALGGLVEIPGGPIDGSQCSALASGDFDGDGAPDLAMGCDAATLGVAIALVPRLRVAQPHFVATVVTGAPVLALAVADLDGDGFVDLAAGETGTIEILHGRGDGSFARGEEVVGVTSPTALAAGDFDGDGRLDLAEIGPDEPHGGRTLLLVHNTRHEPL